MQIFWGSLFIVKWSNCADPYLSKPFIIYAEEI